MTIKDVAEYSGVSVSTVSRVLNRHPDVSDAARRRVMKAVQELHYIPNDSARNLVKTHSTDIGVVVRGAENPFFTPIIRAIEQETREAGCELVLHQIRADEDELSAGAALVRAKRLNGVIFLGGRYDYTSEEVAVLQAPFVCCTYTNQFGSLDQTSFSSVSINDEEEAYRAVKLLTDRGHRCIAALLDATGDRSISELRYRGYCRALMDAGIALDSELLVETEAFDMASAYRGTRRLMEKRKDVTALFAIADSLAIAAMKAIHDAGRKVPEECSVIAIDGIDMSLYTVPTLTTLSQPQETMGVEAARILLGLKDGEAENRHIRLKTTLRSGGTVADCIG